MNACITANAVKWEKKKKRQETDQVVTGLLFFTYCREEQLLNNITYKHVFFFFQPPNHISIYKFPITAAAEVVNLYSWHCAETMKAFNSNDNARKECPHLFEKGCKDSSECSFQRFYCFHSKNKSHFPSRFHTVHSLALQLMYNLHLSELGWLQQCSETCWATRCLITNGMVHSENREVNT